MGVGSGIQNRGGRGVGSGIQNRGGRVGNTKPWG